MARRLVVEGRRLFMYNQAGHLQLTEAQAERERADKLADFLRSQGFDPNQIV